MNPCSKSASAAVRFPYDKRGIFALLLLAAMTAASAGQGTYTFRFEGAPVGTEVATNYTEFGMGFRARPPGQLFLNGGGIPGYPDNGTGFLEIPDGLPGGIGGLTFMPTNPIPALAPFNLVSFDAAEYGGIGPQNLEVIGYRVGAGTVTNFFSVNSQTFQTFNLDSGFQNLFKVDVINARWSLDNLVISGVPEPSSSALIALGTLCATQWRRASRKQPR